MCLRGLRLNECTSVSVGMTTTHADHARMNINCEGFVASGSTKGNKRRGNVLEEYKVLETGKRQKTALGVRRQLNTRGGEKQTKKQMGHWHAMLLRTLISWQKDWSDWRNINKKDVACSTKNLKDYFWLVPYLESRNKQSQPIRWHDLLIWGITLQAQGIKAMNLTQQTQQSFILKCSSCIGHRESARNAEAF